MSSATSIASIKTAARKRNKVQVKDLTEVSLVILFVSLLVERSIFVFFNSISITQCYFDGIFSVRSSSVSATSLLLQRLITVFSMQPNSCSCSFSCSVGSWNFSRNGFLVKVLSI